MVKIQNGQSPYKPDAAVLVYIMMKQIDGSGVATFEMIESGRVTMARVLKPRIRSDYVRLYSSGTTGWIFGD